MIMEVKKNEVIKAVDNFVRNFKAQIDGQRRSELTTAKITVGGARIDYILTVIPSADLQLLDPLNGVTNQDIIFAVRNASAIGMRLSQPELALQHLIKRQVSKMKPVSLRCARLVHQELIGMITDCIDTAQGCPLINAAICRAAKILLNNRMEVTKEILENYIDVQASTGPISDSNYRREFANLMNEVNLVDLGDVPLTGKATNGTEGFLMGMYSRKLVPAAEQAEMQSILCDSMKQLVSLNFNVVRKQVQDYMPRSIQNAFIYNVVDNLKYELTKNVFSDKAVQQLIWGPVATLRESLIEDIQSLTEASKLLHEVKQSSFVED